MTYIAKFATDAADAAAADKITAPPPPIEIDRRAAAAGSKWAARRRRRKLVGADLYASVVAKCGNYELVYCRKCV